MAIYYTAYLTRALYRNLGLKEPPVLYRRYHCWGNPERFAEVV